MESAKNTIKEAVQAIQEFDFGEDTCNINQYDAQSWTALFRAFSSHRQPSASRTKLFPSCTKQYHK